jgi:hypothetical protein
VASSIRSGAAQSKNTSQLLTMLRLEYRAEWSVPWLNPDPAAPIEQMSLLDLVGVHWGSYALRRDESREIRWR